MTDKQEELYAEAGELTGYNALALRAMALWAYGHRKNKEAMRIASFVWGRNARHLANAVEFFPYEFEREQNVNEYLSLFTMASAGKEKATALVRAWRDESLDLWQVRERVNEMKKRAPRSSNCQEEKLFALLRKIRKGLNDTDASDNEIIEWIDDALAKE